MTSQTTDTPRTAAASDDTMTADARNLLDDVAARAGEAVDLARARMPAVADTATAALNESARRLDESPDEVLRLGTALAGGIALGLYIGGAPRIVVSLAMIPAAAMAFTLLGRSDQSRKTVTRG